MDKFTIYGTLPGLNEYTKANRSNFYMANKLKQDTQKIIIAYILKDQVRHYDNPITLSIKWYEPNNRRDIDNVVFATKFIQDSMVSCGIIADDSRKYITALEHVVLTDKNNPRIEVYIYENNGSR